MGAFPLVIKGGAIVSRQGQASFMRGVEVNFTKFFASINCPILLTVHGYGICEVGVFVPLAEDVILGYKSCASNDDGLEQVLSVFKRSGVKEVPIAHSTTIVDDFEAGGEKWSFTLAISTTLSTTGLRKKSSKSSRFRETSTINTTQLI